MTAPFAPALCRLNGNVLALRVPPMIFPGCFERVSGWMSPAAVKKMNGWLSWFWTIHQPIVIFLYVVLSSEKFERFCLLYLAIVSIWANQAAHFAAWVAGRVEVKQEETQ